MLFLTQFLLITTVICQEARIYHDKHKNRSSLYKKFKCHSNLDDSARGVNADYDVYVDFFENSDCRGHWRRRAWGKTTFDDSINYRSIRLSRRERGDRSINVESSSDEDDGGHESHDD